MACPLNMVEIQQIGVSGSLTRKLTFAGITLMIEIAKKILDELGFLMRLLNARGSCVLARLSKS